MYYFIDIFDEALRRTMQVINGARDEIVRIILPKQPDEILLPSERAPAGILKLTYMLRMLVFHKLNLSLETPFYDYSTNSNLTTVKIYYH